MATLCSRFCVSREFDDFDPSVRTIGFDAMLRYSLRRVRRVRTAGFNFEPSNPYATDTSVGVKLGVDFLGSTRLRTDVNTHYVLVGASYRF